MPFFHFYTIPLNCLFPLLILLFIILFVFSYRFLFPFTSTVNDGNEPIPTDVLEPELFMIYSQHEALYHLRSGSLRRGRTDRRGSGGGTIGVLLARLTLLTIRYQCNVSIIPYMCIYMYIDITASPTDFSVTDVSS